LSIMKGLISIAIFSVLIYSKSTEAMEYRCIQDSTRKIVTSTQDSTKKSTTLTPSIPKSKLGVDMMVLLSGEVKEIEIRKFSMKFIYYSRPGESTMVQIDRRLVNIIYYRSGRKEVITPKSTDIPKNNDWEKVIITENPKDVGSTMVEIDVIEVVVEANSDDHYYKPQTLENSALIILKKKAAMLNGVLVLIKKKTRNQPYGEAPSINIQAIAYRRI